MVRLGLGIPERPDGAILAVLNDIWPTVQLDALLIVKDLNLGALKLLSEEHHRPLTRNLQAKSKTERAG